MDIQRSFSSFRSASVLPDQGPTRSVAKPTRCSRSADTPSASSKQTARSPSVKPPGFSAPANGKAVWWVTTKGKASTSRDQTGRRSLQRNTLSP
jgi:hypothetical protein